MGNVIAVDFRKPVSKYPEQFRSGWLAALHKRCDDPAWWTYHAKMRIYKTEKSFAVVISTGLCGKGMDKPPMYSNRKPVYKKTVEAAWNHALSHLEHLGCDIGPIERLAKLA